MSKGFKKAVRSGDGLASRAKVYTEVNLEQPKEYWDYENFEPEWR